MKIAVDLEGKELVDEAMAPLFLLVREHGLHPVDADEGNPEELTPACLIFPAPDEALDFLTTTQHYTDYALGERIMLSILPLSEAADIPRAKVNWLPALTPAITEAWRLSRK